MLVKIGRNWKPIHCWQEYKNGVAALEKSPAILQIVKSYYVTQQSTPLSGLYPRKYLFYDYNIHINKSVETIQVPIS